MPLCRKRSYRSEDLKIELKKAIGQSNKHPSPILPGQLIISVLEKENLFDEIIPDLVLKGLNLALRMNS